MVNTWALLTRRELTSEDDIYRTNIYEYSPNRVASYKCGEWLLLSSEGKKRSNSTVMQFYKIELESCLRIYEVCSCYEPYGFEYINMFHLSQ